MGHRFSKLLMRNASQSAEDGSLGIVVASCDATVQSRQFYGPKGIYGPAVLQAEERMASAEVCDAMWEASCAATGATWSIS